MKTAYIIIATIIVIISMPFLARYLYKFYRGNGDSEIVSFISSVFMSVVFMGIICAAIIAAVAVMSGSIWVIVFLVQLPLRLF